MVEGQNQNSRTTTAQEYQGGTVHLLDTTLSDGDGDSALSSNSEASTTTADSDWAITHDNGAGTTTLTNSSAIDFGSVSGFTVNQIVLESSTTAGNFLIDNSPSGDVNLSGSGSARIEAGQLSYTLGSE